MLNAAIIGLTAALAVLPGCANAERKPADMASMQNPQSPAAMSASALDCDLRVAIQASSGSLLLGYEFRNRSNRTAFLFNVVHRTGPSGGPEADPNLVYVQPAGQAVVLGKRIFPVPQELDVEKPEVPYVTRVEPGGVFVEKLSLMLPLRVFSPYPQVQTAVPAEAAAYFELGFFLAPDPSVAKQAGGNLVIYPFPAEKQTILRAGPLGRFPIQPAQR